MDTSGAPCSSHRPLAPPPAPRPRLALQLLTSHLLVCAGQLAPIRRRQRPPYDRRAAEPAEGTLQIGAIGAIGAIESGASERAGSSRAECSERSWRRVCRRWRRSALRLCLRMRQPCRWRRRSVSQCEHRCRRRAMRQWRGCEGMLCARL